MFSFEDFAGQSAHIAQLQGDFAAHAFVHAYLFASPKGTGKRSVAQLCAQTAVCRGEKKPCGQCGPCRRVLAGTHPDVHTVTAPKGKASIGVDVLREVIETVSVRSFEDGTKAILFPEADKMTVQAQLPAQNARRATAGHGVLPDHRSAGGAALYDCIPLPNGALPSA